MRPVPTVFLRLAFSPQLTVNPHLSASLHNSEVSTDRNEFVRFGYGGEDVHFRVLAEV